MRRIILPCLVAGMLVTAACGSSGNSPASPDTGSATTPSATTSPPVLGPNPVNPKPSVAVPDGPPPTTLQVEDITVGTGAEAATGQTLTVHYVGVAWSTKQQFDSSWDRGEPIMFKLGSGQVIPGWDQGLVGMKVGGRRQLIIPPDLAYGPSGAGGAIGPNETLIFVLDLIGVG